VSKICQVQLNWRRVKSMRRGWYIDDVWWK